jgi:hypothetical protein
MVKQGMSTNRPTRFGCRSAGIVAGWHGCWLHPPRRNFTDEGTVPRVFATATNSPARFDHGQVYPPEPVNCHHLQGTPIQWIRLAFQDDGGL